MRARPDYQPDPDSSCEYEQALYASNVLEQLRPIIGEDRMREIGANPNFQKCDAQGHYNSATRSLEETIHTCLENIRQVRGGKVRLHNLNHLDLSIPFEDRVKEKLSEVEFDLRCQFNFCSVRIDWGDHPNILVEGNGYYGNRTVIVKAPYGYSKQIEAELAWTDNKVVGSYSDIEESPDGILTGRCQYAKMDKHHNWYVHDGYLAWMPHDECIKVKALGDDREKAERAARSAARREVLAALG
tara:strand:+ start:528 stop:1256 length:729 start_codon:yes stop_codon:yes gene_type:complete